MFYISRIMKLAFREILVVLFSVSQKVFISSVLQFVLIIASDGFSKK